MIIFDALRSSSSSWGPLRGHSELTPNCAPPARRRDPSTLDDLTPQEFQIASLVASGMTNRQIAAQLYLSPRTIEYHLRKIFTELRLSSRTELVRMGVPSGDEDL